MIINCGNRRLVSDKYQWVIQKRHIAPKIGVTGKPCKNPGKITWRPEQPAYPSNLANALEEVYIRLLKDEGEIDIQELVVYCKKAAKTIRRYITVVRNSL